MTITETVLCSGRVLLTLDQLEVLDAIARLGSFSAAAQELHRATSAVSYAIKTLESSLGVSVFDRSGHRAQLTESGRLILREGRGLLDGARRIERLARRLQEDWEPKLSVVIDGVLPIRPIMAAIQRFAAEELPTTIDLRVEYLSKVRERFEAESFDLMLTMDKIVDSELVVKPIAQLEMVLLAHRDHPLSSQTGPMSRDTFSKHVELLVSPTAGRHMPHIAGMYLGGAHVVHLSDFNSKREALLGGVGFGWMPRHLVDEALERGELVVLPFEEGPEHRFTPQLVFRKEPPLGRGAELFVKFLEEAH